MVRLPFESSWPLGTLTPTKLFLHLVQYQTEQFTCCFCTIPKRGAVLASFRTLRLAFLSITDESAKAHHPVWGIGFLAHVFLSPFNSSLRQDDSSRSTFNRDFFSSLKEDGPTLSAETGSYIPSGNMWFAFFHAQGVMRK